MFWNKNICYKTSNATLQGKKEVYSELHYIDVIKEDTYFAFSPKLKKVYTAFLQFSPQPQTYVAG